MNLKILLFSQIFLLLFPFSSSNIKHNQQFIIEKENLKNKNGIPHINFIKIKFNKVNENNHEETFEIDLEIIKK